MKQGKESFGKHLAFPSITFSQSFSSASEKTLNVQSSVAEEMAQPLKQIITRQVKAMKVDKIIPDLTPVLLCPKPAEVGRLDETAFLFCTFELSDTKTKKNRGGEDKERLNNPFTIELG